MKRVLVAFGIFMCFHMLGFAQEQLLPLMGHMELRKEKHLPQRNLAERKAAAGAPLPFFDDFSEPFNQLPYAGGYWPDQSRWTDFQAFINDNLPIDPISVGVATLDGVDGLGRPYSWFGSNFSQPADSLTSIPIDLSSTIDTVVFSFFYQPGGRSSYDPEANDSLIVEFKAVEGTDTVWHTVWNVEGSDSDSSWKLIMLPIVNNIFLHEDFQFRFKNHASLHSNGDFWHIDYVLLDEGRSVLDTSFNDMSILERPSRFLSEFATMPWTHFKTDPSAFMVDTHHFRVRNNYDQSLVANHKFRILDSNGAERHVGDESNPEIFPFTACGNTFADLTVCNNDPGDNFTLSTFGAEFPTDVELSPESAFFAVENLLFSVDDDVSGNDTVVRKQEFYNYYAYDDGTAEVAYGLGFLDEPGRVALRYDVKMPDVLRGVQMYFDPIRWDLREEPFQIEVWAGDSVPEELIYATDTIFPDYTGTDIFYHYVFDTLLNRPAGPIFIGWTQPANEEINFTVGFDLSFDASANVFYNLSDDWIQSSIPGSVMFRPMFGSEIDETPNSVQDRFIPADFTLYPNPTDRTLNISAVDLGSVYILDMTGRTVLRSQLSSVDVSALDAGVYLVNPTDKTGRSLGVKRFIKQ